MSLKTVVYTAAVVVLGICIYSFLLGTKILEGRFDNDSIPWYFLAKGIFCSLSLYLSYQVLDCLRKKSK